MTIPHHHYHFEQGRHEQTPLLLLHGTGADEFDLIPLARQIAPDATILSVRGNVVEHGQKRYFKRLENGAFDQEDLTVRTQELADFVAATAPKHGIDLSRLVALGFSNGANIASALFFNRPEILRGGILLRGMVPMHPPDALDLRGKSILLHAGDQDPIIPVDNSATLAAIYEHFGADIVFNRFATGHGLIPQDVIEATRWYQSLEN